MPALSNQKHERFALLVATKGQSDLQAYQQAYGCGPASAKANAYRLMENDGIVNRIKELQGKVENKSVMSLSEKRAYLADLVRLAPAKLTPDSPLCQGVKPTKFGPQLLIPDKLTALKLDAQLAGELVDRQQLDVRLGIFSVEDAKVIDI